MFVLTDAILWSKKCGMVVVFYSVKVIWLIYQKGSNTKTLYFLRLKTSDILGL